MRAVYLSRIRLLGPRLREGNPMDKVVAATTVVLMTVSQALANEAKGNTPDYSGITYMYYTLIGAILAYGVYDTFFKKS
jgi:hypothetical protein